MLYVATGTAIAAVVEAVVAAVVATVAIVVVVVVVVVVVDEEEAEQAEQGAGQKAGQEAVLKGDTGRNNSMDRTVVPPAMIFKQNCTYKNINDHRSSQYPRPIWRCLPCTQHNNCVASALMNLLVNQDRFTYYQINVQYVYIGVNMSVCVCV